METECRKYLRTSLNSKLSRVRERSDYYTGEKRDTEREGGGGRRKESKRHRMKDERGKYSGA